MALGRSCKVSDALINDKQASRTFDEKRVKSLDAEFFEALANGMGAQTRLRNWDVPRAMDAEEVFQLVTKALLQWSHHFRFPIFDKEVGRLVRMREHADVCVHAREAGAKVKGE